MGARELDEVSRGQQPGVEELLDGLVSLPAGRTGLDRTWLLGNRGIVEQLRQTAVGAPPHRERVARVRPRVRDEREVVGGRLVAQVEDHLAAGRPAAPAAVSVSSGHRRP